MANILGLDVSTSIIGYAILPIGAAAYDPPIEMGHIDLRKCKDGFWQKTDTAKVEIEALCTKYNFEHIFIEDPLQKFRKGASSAHTISLLSKFNALCSYFVRQAAGVDPVYIGATQARKLCSVPIIRKKKKKCIETPQKSAKEQTFDYLCTNVFINKEWPKTKKGNIQVYCGDQVDAYVIALAGSIQNLNTPVTGTKI